MRVCLPSNSVLVASDFLAGQLAAAQRPSSEWHDMPHKHSLAFTAIRGFYLCYTRTINIFELKENKKPKKHKRSKKKLMTIIKMALWFLRMNETQFFTRRRVFVYYFSVNSRTILFHRLAVYVRCACISYENTVENVCIARRKDTHKPKTTHCGYI